MIIIDRRTFVVFDLDDTLYKERDYLQSGLRSVADCVRELYQRDVLQQLNQWASAPGTDIWRQLCLLLNIPVECKTEFLWLYRLHVPRLALEQCVSELLLEIKEKSIGVAILTDGRSISQRYKIQSLGLGDIPAYISEEFASVKPDPGRYIQIEKDHPADRYVYVGDNPKKDFIAPNKLGWTCIGLTGDDRNIHAQSIDNHSIDQLPKLWIHHLNELRKFIC